MSFSPSHAAPPSRKRRRVGQTYDVFISHAGPDKDTIAKPLHEKLEKLGISAFVDDKEMPPGREAPSAMMEAMETAGIGVFILSADFVARRWPVKELYCFLERVEKATFQRREKPVLIPVFYRLRIDQCHCIESLLGLHEGGRSPFIEGRFIQRQRMAEPEADLDKLQAAFTSLVSHMGIKNRNNVTNEDSNDMMEKRVRFVDEIVDGVDKSLKEKDGVKGNIPYASHLAADVAVETIDSFHARFDVPLPLPNIVLNWNCDLDGEPMTIEGRLKKEIMDSTQDRDASAVAAVDGAPIGVCGHGGVGKTCAMIGVGREKDVQQHFKDGVYFVTIGGDATDGSIVKALAQLVRQCGGVKMCNQISDCESLGEATPVAASYFRGKRALFMFDDLWPTGKSSVGYLKEIRQLVVTCPQSRILISTRSRSIARAGRRQVLFEPREAEGRVARKILCRSAEIEMEETLEYKNELGIVLRSCKGLPLTLQVAGCAIRELRDDGLLLRDAIESYVEDLQAGINKPATKSSEEYPSFEDTVRVSLRMADKWYQRLEGHRGRSGKTVSELYERLAVLKRQMHAPKSMLKALWALETSKETDAVLKKLRDLNLVKRRKKGNELGAEVHDLLLEFCELAAGGKVKDYHADVLSGYYRLKGESASQSRASGSGIGPGGWSDVEAGVRCWWEEGLSKGYIAENVCRHLAEAGKCAELAMLLTDARWALAQTRRRRLTGWVGDFDELFGAIQKRKTGGTEGLVLKDAQKGLELVRDGVREAWHFVRRNEREFGWQIYARLVDQGAKGWAVRRLLESISRHAERPWLRPRSRCFPVPGEKRLVVPFDDEVVAVAFLGDKAVVSSTNNGISILNEETGERQTIAIDADKFRRVMDDVDIGSDRQMRDIVLVTLEDSLYVALSRDGGRTVYGSWDDTLRVWDAKRRESVGESLHGHTNWVRFAAISGDGRHIVSQSSDGALRVWNARTGECVSKPPRGHWNWARSVAVSGDGRRVVFRSPDDIWKVWDARTGDDVGKPLRGHSEGVTCLTMSADGRVIVGGCIDGTITVWDALSGECVGEPLRGHAYVVTDVAVSADGRLIVSGSWDHTVRVWDAVSGDCVGGPLRGHGDSVECVALSKDGRLILSASDKTVRVWSAKSGECTGEPSRGRTHRVTCVAVSGDRRRVMSGSLDCTVKMWDAESGECVSESFCGYTRALTCMALSGDGRLIVAGCKDGTVRVWDARKGGCVGEPLRGHTGGVRCVAVSGDGRRIVSGAQDNKVRAWDAESGECVGELPPGDLHMVTCVAISGDGRWVVSGSTTVLSENIIDVFTVWDTRSGKVGGPSRQHHLGVNRLVMTGTTVVAHGRHGRMKWQVDENAELVSVQGKGEDDVLDLWSHSTVVMMCCRSQKFIAATLPSEVVGWDLDLRHKIFAAGLEDGSVICGELVV